MKLILATFLLLLGTITSAADFETNLQIIVNSANGMEFSDPENKPYLLVKRGLIRSPVALIFGYWDNEAACDELAHTLSQSGTAGTFICDAIYQGGALIEK